VHTHCNNSCMKIFWWILLSITILGAIVFFIGTNKDKDQKIVSPQPSSNTNASTEEKAADFNIYTSPKMKITFKYPKDWYYKTVPGWTDETTIFKDSIDKNVCFFVKGTEADFGFGDRTGNEVLCVNIAEDNRTLEEIKNADEVLTTLDGKKALKMGTYSIRVQVDDRNHMSIAGTGLPVISNVSFLP